MVKIFGNSASLKSQHEEPKLPVPREFGDKMTVIAPRTADASSATNSERLIEMRTILKNLQESQGGLEEDCIAKEEIADKADSIALELKERLATFSDLNGKIDAFYQQHIENSIREGDVSMVTELPTHLADQKREVDALERQIIVAENFARTKREEEKASRHEIYKLEQNITDAIQRIMSFIAEMGCNEVNSLCNKYENAVVDLLALTRQNFYQMDIYKSSGQKNPVYSYNNLTVSQRVLSASKGYNLDIGIIAAKYLGKLGADQNKWSNTIKRLQKDAYADCGDLCRDLPDISSPA